VRGVPGDERRAGVGRLVAGDELRRRV